MFEKISREILFNTDGNWVEKLIVGVSLLAVVLLLHFIIFKILFRLNKKDRFLLKNIHKRFKLPSLIFLLVLSVNIVFIAYAGTNATTNHIKHLLNVLIILAIAWLLTRFIRLGKDVILKRYDINEKDNLKARRVYTQYKILESILVFMVVLIAISGVLMTFEGIRKIGVSLFASAGVAGIILGFAAQKMIGTVLAGFQIAITQPIRLDDVVIVENEWGWIEEITLTYVVVRIWDKRRLVVPTTYFIEKPFQNWTRNSADIMGTVFIYTDYKVPFDALRDELTRILEEDDRWDGKVNVLQVTDATEKTIELRALVSAVDSPSAWDLRVNVREKLIAFLQREYPESLPHTRLLLDEKKQ